jgi:hypothetical protein
MQLEIDSVSIAIVKKYFSVLLSFHTQFNVQTLLFNICCRCSCIRYLELPINTKFPEFEI